MTFFDFRAYKLWLEHHRNIYPISLFHIPLHPASCWINKEQMLHMTTQTTVSLVNKLNIKQQHQIETFV